MCNDSKETTGKYEREWRVDPFPDEPFKMENLKAQEVASDIKYPSIQQTLNKLHYTEATRQPLHESIAYRIKNAQDKANELSKLKRLTLLLDTHSEVFEIITLMRDLNL